MIRDGKSYVFSMISQLPWVVAESNTKHFMKRCSRINISTADISDPSDLILMNDHIFENHPLLTKKESTGELVPLSIGTILYEFNLKCHEKLPSGARYAYPSVSYSDFWEEIGEYCDFIHSFSESEPILAEILFLDFIWMGLNENSSQLVHGWTTNSGISRLETTEIIIFNICPLSAIILAATFSDIEMKFSKSSTNMTIFVPDYEISTVIQCLKSVNDDAISIIKEFYSTEDPNLDDLHFDPLDFDIGTSNISGSPRNCLNIPYDHRPSLDTIIEISLNIRRNSTPLKNRCTFAYYLDGDYYRIVLPDHLPNQISQKISWNLGFVQRTKYEDWTKVMTHGEQTEVSFENAPRSQTPIFPSHGLFYTDCFPENRKWVHQRITLRNGPVPDPDSNMMTVRMMKSRDSLIDNRMNLPQLNHSMQKLLDFRNAGNIDSFIFFLTANPTKSGVKLRTKLALIHNANQDVDTISNFLRDSLKIPPEVNHEVSEIEPDFALNLATKQSSAVQSWISKQTQFT